MDPYFAASLARKLQKERFELAEQMRLEAPSDSKETSVIPPNALCLHPEVQQATSRPT